MRPSVRPHAAIMFGNLQRCDRIIALNPLRTEFLLNNIVTSMPIARQRLCKHTSIPAEANARNNKTSIARQRISKHTSLTIGLFSAWSVQSGYKEEF
jgi:hypothetical protein